MRGPTPPQSLPFALVEGGTKGLRLSALNQAARNFGLMRGQRLADARAAVPDLLTEQHETEKDVTSLLGLCRWMERYSPWVAPDGRDGILLDVTGIPHLFGGEAAMQKDIQNKLMAYGFSSRAGLAETIGAAWALAHYAAPFSTGADTFKNLPIEALRIDTNAARTLRRLGLKTIGSLLSLPRSSLARRFRGESIDENVLLRLDELQGHRHEPLNAINPPSSFMAHRALMEPVITHEGLQAILSALTQNLCHDLEAKRQGALRLILKLFRSDGSRAQLPAGLSAPSHNPGHILRLLTPKLDSLDAGFGIDAMTLEARETASMVERQYGFTDDVNQQTLSQLNDRVMNRQDQTLTQLQALQSHVPERAEIAAGFSETTQPALTYPMQNHRPLLIFEHPEPAAVIAAVPDGPPMRLTWRRVTRRIVKSRGPERIAPEWWKLTSGERPRDYYSIEDDQGRRYWLYRDGLYGEENDQPPKWFVHGLSA